MQELHILRHYRETKLLISKVIREILSQYNINIKIRDQFLISSRNPDLESVMSRSRIANRTQWQMEAIIPQMFKQGEIQMQIYHNWLLRSR